MQTFLIVVTETFRNVYEYCFRLKDYCERLIFHDPTEYGRKAEELIWRKVFYEPIQTMKQFKKVGSSFSTMYY